MPKPTAAEDDSSTTDQAPSEPGGLSRWVAPLALVIALIAAAGAGWALLRPAPERTSQSAEAPTGDPKANACSAFKTVSTAVSLQTHGEAGPEPAGVLAVAANARLAMADGANYLLARTSPGTPKDLSDAIHSFATGLQDITMYALAGVGNEDPAQAARLHAAEAANNRIAELCK